MFFIDIAVPRDVDPAMNKLDGIFVYDIDDLQSVSAGNLALRNQEAEQAEQIVATEVDHYHQRLQTLDAVPAIVALQQALEEMRQGELLRSHNRLAGLTEEQMAAVDALTRGLVNKFLHAPLQGLKSAARDGDRAALEMALRIFAIDRRKKKEPKP